jgi:hypothetical protein
MEKSQGSPPHLPGGEIALKYFECAQDDIQQRLELKQKLMTFYLAGLAGIIGFVYQRGMDNPSAPELLLVIPVLSLGAATFISNHLLVIAGLVLYQIQDLEPHLGSGQVVMWEKSRGLRMVVEKTGASLHVNEVLLICVPGLASIAAFLLRIFSSHGLTHLGMAGVAALVALELGMVWLSWTSLRRTVNPMKVLGGVGARVPH